MSIKDFFTNLNNKYGSLNKKQLATKLLKEGVDAGTAIVNILSATGIAGFKFHVPETEQVQFENEITDHYIETGSTIQDHVAQRPITITLTGLVGDYFYSVNQIEDMLARVVPTVQLVKDLLPQVSNITKQVKNAKYAYEASQSTGAIKEAIQNNVANGVSQSALNNAITGTAPDAISQILGNTTTITPSAISQAVSNYEPKLKRIINAITNNVSGEDLFALFQSLYKIKSAQTRAFLFFEGLWKRRIAFSVETTWKRYDNMIVERITPSRDNNADITEFSITVKQVNYAETQTVNVSDTTNRVEQQSVLVVNKGLEQGEEIKLF